MKLARNTNPGMSAYLRNYKKPYRTALVLSVSLVLISTCSIPYVSRIQQEKRYGKHSIKLYCPHHSSIDALMCSKIGKPCGEVVLFVGDKKHCAIQPDAVIITGTIVEKEIWTSRDWPKLVGDRESTQRMLETIPELETIPKNETAVFSFIHRYADAMTGEVVEEAYWIGNEWKVHISDKSALRSIKRIRGQMTALYSLTILPKNPQTTELDHIQVDVLDYRYPYFVNDSVNVVMEARNGHHIPRFLASTEKLTMGRDNQWNENLR